MTKEFSTIGLKTFFEFSGKAPPGDIRLSQADFFLDGTGVTLPRAGHTFLYGYKTSRFLLASAISRAMDSNREFCLVNAEARIGTWSPNKIRLDNIGEVRFVNVPRGAGKELVGDMQRTWEGLLNKHGLSPDADHFPRKPSRYMHLLDELILIPPYDQLTAMAYIIETSLGVANVVTVFRPEDIVSVEVNSIHPVNLSFEFGPVGRKSGTAIRTWM